MQIPEFTSIVHQNDQTQARREHLRALAELIGDVYPNAFERSGLSGGEDSITALCELAVVSSAAQQMAAAKAELAEGERLSAELKDDVNARLRNIGTVRTAGRLTTPTRGNFVHLTDGRSKLQIYCKKGQFSLIRTDGTEDPDNGWAAWGLLDHGDFVGVEGYLFVTNTGEVSIHVEKLQFLAKALLPMPDKMHGIEDAEIKQRQRYVDLIGSSMAVDADGLTTRRVFEIRSKTISAMRTFLENDGFIEVETPMLTSKATGAAAKPFRTHHNALDIELFARIAPELYLKRLLVGGFEKVYELNRNFRNEGLSFKHNPEFTMLEFYAAYMNVDGMMDLCEELMRNAVRAAFNKHTVVVKAKQTTRMFLGEKGVEPRGFNVTVGHSSRSTPRNLKLIMNIVLGVDYLNVSDQEINFGSFNRLSVKDAVIKYAADWNHWINEDVAGFLDDGRKIRALRQFIYWVENELESAIGYSDGSEFVRHLSDDEASRLVNEKWTSLLEVNSCVDAGSIDSGLELMGLFEDVVEENLIQPTFIVDYPKSISPLAKASPENPQTAERFELFINGMEVANGFSELNDPQEQYDRFVDQMRQRESGDEEAMVLDEDYIRALSYAMPPAAGIGIGIDRLVMLLTGRHSIRDVILFPHMRPERGRVEETVDDTEPF